MESWPPRYCCWIGGTDAAADKQRSPRPPSSSLAFDRCDYPLLWLVRYITHRPSAMNRREWRLVRAPAHVTARITHLRLQYAIVVAHNYDSTDPTFPVYPGSEPTPPQNYFASITRKRLMNSISLLGECRNNQRGRPPPSRRRGWTLFEHASEAFLASTACEASAGDGDSPLNQQYTSSTDLCGVCRLLPQQWPRVFPHAPRRSLRLGACSSRAETHSTALRSARRRWSTAACRTP